MGRLQFVLIVFENDFDIVFGVEWEQVLQFRSDCWEAKFNAFISVHLLPTL